MDHLWCSALSKPLVAGSSLLAISSPVAPQPEMAHTRGSTSALMWSAAPAELTIHRLMRSPCCSKPLSYSVGCAAAAAVTLDILALSLCWQAASEHFKSSHICLLTLVFCWRRPAPCCSQGHQAVLVMFLHRHAGHRFGKRFRSVILNLGNLLFRSQAFSPALSALAGEQLLPCAGDCVLDKQG